MTRPMISFLLIVSLRCWTIADALEADGADVDFSRDVAPILASKCLGCHSQNISKGEFSLSTSDDLELAGYLVPGEPDDSYLIELVTAIDGQPPRMPQEGGALSADEVDVLRRWIDEGAVWPAETVVREASKADENWWSLQPITRPDVPQADDAAESWRRNPIDRFVAARQQGQGLQPNPPADRRTLIRRLTYDLTGLPPTETQVQSFVNDTHPLAYRRLVDRLMASPEYGRRWGRHWLDVVRFGESSGFEQNFILDNLWPFRDYVIDRVNADHPFDEIIREHLAGDVLGRDDPETTIGRAFLVAGPWDAVKNQDAVQAAQIRANTIDERIRASSEAFLGLTVGCARCHDHKFDPIRQTDYYSLYAVFSGIRHGAAVWATPQQKAADRKRRQPLQQQRNSLDKRVDELRESIQAKAERRSEEIAANWTRPAVNRRGTEETFTAVPAKFIRLVSEGQDENPNNTNAFNVDEFEVFAADQPERNVAAATEGGKATGASRQIEDFPNAYGPHLAIDGKFGERFLAIGGSLTVEFAEVETIDRVYFSSARIERVVDHGKFRMPGEYRLEVSLDGTTWRRVADSHDRQPVTEAWRNKRLFDAAITPKQRQQLAKWNTRLGRIRQQLDELPSLPQAWIGTLDAEAAEGPFHVFVGGSPQRVGEVVQPRSLESIKYPAASFNQAETSNSDGSPIEATRRLALAHWITDPGNPLTARVMANRLWHHHFGTGIVATPNDFGYMGSPPSHPDLLDWLADELIRHQWRWKPLHRLIVTSETYRQSGAHRATAANVDAESRWLWRYPPRRLSAEEIRDTLLRVAGVLDRRHGGPGFRLYRYLRDNVSTYIPRDEVGPETYRRAVYHQNARASVVDLMTEFDQPDCAFSAPRRSETTTPLQALTMLNHSFTLDMAEALTRRAERDADGHLPAVIERMFRLCYQRPPSPPEHARCLDFARHHGSAALARVLLNTSELIHVE